jgi:Protein of unknown function (DUF4054)
LSIDNILKDYILNIKSIEDIISDFQTQFPQYATYSDELLTIYIDLNFYLIPISVIYIGFDLTYKMFLYSLAHLLVSQDVQADGSTSSADDRLAQTMTADGVSVGYKNLAQDGNYAEWEYFFGSTNYGRIVLQLLKNKAFNASRGVRIV